MTAGRRGFQTYLFRLGFSFFKNSRTSVRMMSLACRWRRARLDPLGLIGGDITAPISWLDNDSRADISHRYRARSARHAPIMRQLKQICSAKSHKRAAFGRVETFWRHWRPCQKKRGEPLSAFPCLFDRLKIAPGAIRTHGPRIRNPADMLFSDSVR